MPTEDISMLVTLELPIVGKETGKIRALAGQRLTLPVRKIPLPVLRLPWLVEALNADATHKTENNSEDKNVEEEDDREHE